MRQGIEDVKLFNLKNELLFIGTNKEGKLFDKVIFGNFNIDDHSFLQGSCIHVTFNIEKSEKNWSLYIDENFELKLIYSWYPLKICKIDDNKLILLNTYTMPDNFIDYRGSSCGVNYNNEIWFLIHVNNNYVYKEGFVVFSKDMNLIKYSELFNLKDKREFTYSFIINDNNMIIPFSINNDKSYINIYDMNDINNMIWTYIDYICLNFRN